MRQFVMGRLSFAALVLCVAAGVSAAETGSLEILVKDRGGESVRDAVVVVIEANRRAGVDRDGKARFEKLAAGEYQIQINSGDFGTKLERVTVTAGQLTSLETGFDVRT